VSNKRDSSFPELDHYCREIFFRLIIFGKKRFKELHEILLKTGVPMSKPTLSNHLTHLTEANLVIRKLEEVHNVSYDINHEQVDEFAKQVKLTVKSQERITEEEKWFNSMKADDQIDVVLEKMLLINLRQLKLNIEIELNPKSKAKNLLLLHWLAHPIHRHFESLLIFKCKNDEKYGELVLQKLDEIIEQIKELNTSNG
jgi:DNA-binding transcriptional ArsR family regulator